MKKITVFLALLMTVITFCVGVHAELMTVTFEYQNDKSAAEEMLRLINQYRGSGDAWILDSNEKRVNLGKLKALEVDPDLSEAARQRALEQVLSFGHVRPNGTICFSVIDTPWDVSCAENAGMNHEGCTQESFDLFMEESEEYAYQGHRRNILDSFSKHVGIGCVNVAGLSYWVMLFSSGKVGEYIPESTDNKAVIQMEMNYYPEFQQTTIAGEITMYVGESAPLPKVSCNMQTYSSAMLELDFSDNNWMCTSTDPSIVRVEENGIMCAVESGETQLIMTAAGSNLTVNVTVNPINCWKNLNGTWYRYDDHGEFAKGWQKLNGKWYHFDSDGRMQTFWQKIDGRWYYFKADGSMHTGWVRTGGSWYYLDSDGTMATGWRQLQEKWYWFDANGVMATGNRRIGQKTYQFDNNGAWIDDQPANQWKKNDGVWSYYNVNHQKVTGWQMIEGQWYYFNAMGEMQTGWVLYGGHWYYLYGNGAMAADTTLEIKGVTYFFDAHGVMQ